MEKLFNIGGPCNAAKNYMLPAAERLPEVASLINKELYFVIHAPRQCGKTTMFQSLAKEINAKGERAAIYCTVETVQEFGDPAEGLPKIAGALRLWATLTCPEFKGMKPAAIAAEVDDPDISTCVQSTLAWLATKLEKPLVVFIDEVDCLCNGTLITFLRQLRAGKIASMGGAPFPVSVALIGLRNIRDYKMRVRPEGESTGEASPFNVLTEAMTLRSFTPEEMRALYAQHTAATGQAFEEGAITKAWLYSQGQPYLVNALARWCVEKIHGDDFSKPITEADMEEAKGKLVRERGTHLDSLMEKAKDPRCRPIVEAVMTGGEILPGTQTENVDYCLDLGLLIQVDGVLKPANPIYAETLGRYLTREVQDKIKRDLPENPWVSGGRLDMSALVTAFQSYWRENAEIMRTIGVFTEAVPHMILQAFLQRVINGGGQIIREMALGKKALDLGVVYQDEKHAVEIKMKYNYDRDPDKALKQIRGYTDRLGVEEGWLVVFDPDMTKSWDEKIGREDLPVDGKIMHLVKC